MDNAAIPYLVIFLALVIAGALIGTIFGVIMNIIGLAGFIFTAFFFRDPKRKITDDARAIVSPADGKIISIDCISDPAIGDAQRISIFMSPLDVHVNRCPTDGTAIEIERAMGKFKRAFLDEASQENERVEMLLDTPHGTVRVRQIAGIIARRIVCRAKIGDKLQKGQRYGIIHFGSRVELILPKNAEIVAQRGQRALGGETILARWLDK